jgi:hypothetical protein
MDPAKTLYLVEIAESGPGHDSDVRYIGIYSTREKALAYCQGEGREGYLVRPQPETIAAFAVIEVELDSGARGRTIYVDYAGQVHTEWPYARRRDLSGWETREAPSLSDL